MKYEDIKDFNQRCEKHPAHQTGMVSYQMIQDRLSEEIDELRKYIEQRTWVGLTDEERVTISYTTNGEHMKDEDDDIQVYQRPWVGLTKMELIKCGVFPWGMSYRLYEAIEAKLKHKNT